MSIAVLRGLHQQVMYPDALRRIRPASCVRGRVHEAPSGNQAHFFHRHDTMTNRAPEAETA